LNCILLLIESKNSTKFSPKPKSSNKFAFINNSLPFYNGSRIFVDHIYGYRILLRLKFSADSFGRTFTDGIGPTLLHPSGLREARSAQGSLAPSDRSEPRFIGHHLRT